MTHNHTPGPWQVNINNIGGNKSITVRSQLNAAGVSRQIAEVNPYVNFFSEGYTAEGNARLIAAAPEMLEALQAALQGLSNVTAATDEDADRLGQVENALSVIIQKATGE